MALQRVELDEAAGTLRYHNFGTLHRWRTVMLSEVDEIVYDDFMYKRGTLVSAVYLVMREGYPRRLRLIDNRLGPKGRVSPMIRQIARATLTAQPHVRISPNLLRR